MLIAKFRTILKPILYKVLGIKAYEWFYYKGKANDIQAGHFLEPETALFKEFIKHGDEAIDIGSNYGHVSILLAQLATPGTIYSFEPIPFTYRVNRRILNKFQARNVELFNIGVSNVSEEQEFKVPLLDFGAPDTGLAFISTRTFLEHEVFIKYNVPVVSLDEFLLTKLKNLKFVKIDIEGAELLALKGMEKIIDKYKPVLLVEICPDYLKGFNISPCEFEQYIKNILKYDLFTYSHKTKKLIPEMHLRDAYYILIHKDATHSFSYLI